MADADPIATDEPSTPDAVATTLARIDTALASIPDPVVRGAIHSAFQALITPPDPHEVVTTVADPDTGEVTTTSPAPVDDAGTPLTPRDETHDSIDPQTGQLTADAIARRAELQAAKDADDAAVAADKDVVAADQAKLDEDTAKLNTDQAADDAATGALEADQADQAAGADPAA